MVNRQDNYISQVVNRAYDYWQAAPEVCSQIILESNFPTGDLNPETSYNQFDPQNDDHKFILPKIWKSIFSDKTDEALKINTKAILNNPKKGTEDIPDLGLQLWLESIPKDKIEWLSIELIKDIETHDEQKLRLTSQLVENTMIDASTMFELIEFSFSSDLAQTQREIIRLQNDIDQKYSKVRNSTALNECLLKALLLSSSLENKRKLAEWLLDRNAGTTLNKLENWDVKYSKEDLTILGEFFRKKQKLLKKLMNSLPEED